MLFLMNWGMNWWLLWATGTALRRKIRPWVLSMSAAFGSLCAFLWLLIPATLGKELAIKSIVALAMVHLSFVPETLGSLLTHTGVFLGLSALCAGVTYALALTGSGMLGQVLPRVGWYLVVGGPLILTIPLKKLWTSLGRHFRMIEQTTRFRFYWGGLAIELKAALDTGNTLVEPLTYRPVVVLDTGVASEQLPLDLLYLCKHWQQYGTSCLESLPEHVMRCVTLIPYTNVSGSGLMLGIRPERCEIEVGGNWANVMAVVGFASGEIKLSGTGALLPLEIWPCAEGA